MSASLHAVCMSLHVCSPSLNSTSQQSGVHPAHPHGLRASQPILHTSHTQLLWHFECLPSSWLR